MKIGLFFGSFNPIHTGHLIIAQHIINFYTDKVWFVVSPQNPLKENNNLLEIKSRLELVKEAIKTNKKFCICDVELNLAIPSYTIDTLIFLNNKYPEYEFFIIMGSDNFKNILNWKSFDLILCNYKIIIYERNGSLTNFKNLNSTNIFFAEAPLIDISATLIRQLISERKSIQYLVPHKVKSLIEKNKFYIKNN